MQPTHLLDTSVYSPPLRKAPLASVVDRWTRLGEECIAVSVICEAEVRQGLIELGSARLWSLYEEQLRGRFPVLPVDENVAHVYAQLSAGSRSRGRIRPALDLLIAATAKSHQLVLATCNLKHFIDTPGLAVEDWSAGPADKDDSSRPSEP